MRLVEINTVCGRGSTGRIAVNIAEEVRKKGHEAVVVYGRYTTDYEYSYKMSSPIDNITHGLLTRIFDLQGFGSRISTNHLLKFLDEYGPDIIHLHLAHGNYLNLEVLFDYVKKNNIPLIWTMHDCWAFTGHCVHFEHAGCARWMTGCYSCPQKKEFPSSYIFDRSRFNYQRKKAITSSMEKLTVITPSNWLAELVRHSFLREHNTYVIHNGIDLNIFKRENGIFRKKFKLDNKIILLGVADGFGNRKGFDDFIELSKKLDSKFQIVLVGLEKEKLKNLPTNVLGFERTSSIQELVSIYSDANIFLNLTYEDNFPTVNMEALACGTPVISYRTGGSPESLDETCSIIVEQHDIDGLIKAVDIILKMKITPQTCRRRAENYSVEKTYGQYADLILKIYNEEAE